MTKKDILPRLNLRRINGKFIAELSGGHSLDYLAIREQVEEQKFTGLLSNIEVLYCEDKLHELDIFDTEFLNFNGIVYNSSELRLNNNYFLESFYGYSNKVLKIMYIVRCDKLSFTNIHNCSLNNLEKIYVDELLSNILGLVLLPKLKDVLTYASNKDFTLHSLVNKHLQGEKDVLEFQEELITNGYRHFAKL
jgi:hypothetical protein